MRALIPYLFMSLAGSFQQVDSSKVRQLYLRAADSAADAQRLKILLSAIDSNSAAILYCYKGATEMFQARHSKNPLTKLESFGRGKALIEKAVSKDTSDLEMRFIRFSIQSNLPAFLGYRDAVGKDRDFLLKHVEHIEDKELRTMIGNYLKYTDKK